MRPAAWLQDLDLELPFNIEAGYEKDAALMEQMRWDAARYGAPVAHTAGDGCVHSWTDLVGWWGGGAGARAN